MSKTVFLYFIVLLGCGKGIKTDDRNSPIEALNSSSTSTLPTFTKPSAKTVGNDAVPVTIQDIWTIDDNANGKIEKVVNTIKEISSSCKQYESINLSVDGYLFSENTTEISVSLEDNKATFYNFSVSHWNDYNETNFLTASTMLKCDSTSSVIEVSLANNIQVSAKLKITNSTGNLIVKEGTISMILKNPIISYQTPTFSRTKNFNDDAFQLSYDNSETTVKIDTKYQASVYSTLDVIITKMETSLRAFFAKQLEAEINKRNIFSTTTHTCAKMMKKDPLYDLDDTSPLNNFQNDLYLIPTVHHDTWNNVSLRAGPLLIYELFTFNRVEFVAKENSVYNVDRQYRNELRNHTVKLLQVRIKTNAFTGQLEWHYNSNYSNVNKGGSKPSNISFSVDYIDIGCRIMRDKTYSVSASIDKIEINTAPVISCENERSFIDIFLSEYLKYVIAESIAKSVTEKLSDNAPFYVCVDPGYVLVPQPNEK